MNVLFVEKVSRGEGDNQRIQGRRQETEGNAADAIHGGRDKITRLLETQTETMKKSTQRKPDQKRGHPLLVDDMMALVEFDNAAGKHYFCAREKI
jgi:hypothetical protein